MKNTLQMLKKVTAITLALSMLLFAGCSFERQDDMETPLPNIENTVELSGDASAWFCPYQTSPQSDSPAKIINVATGEVLVACPDPLCHHSASSETCFFNYVNDRTKVCGAAYADGHIVFAAEKLGEDGMSMKLYDYDVRTSRMDEVHAFDYIGSTLQLYSAGRKVFFTSIDGDDPMNSQVCLYAYDTSERTVTLIDDNARYALFPTGVAFFDDHYVYDAGYDQDEDRIIYCKRSYDGANEERLDALPDGTPFELFGYQLKSNGLFASTEAGGGVYLSDENRCIAWPVDSATTKPAVHKGRFYFTTRSSEITELGKDPAAGTQALGYAYYNEIYVVDKTGAYKHYTVDNEYHFIIEAAFDNIVLGSIVYRIRDNGDCIRDGGPDMIRINLDTGETTLYDTSLRSEFARKTFITNVTLNDN